MDSIVFVDLSHYIFHRFYALKAWLKLSKQEDISKPDLYSRYERLFEENLISLQKKLKFNWEQVYLVKDCTRDSIWRKELFPEYKSNRDDKTPDERIDPVIFSLTYNTIIPRLIEKLKFHVLSYNNAEADDIVAVLHSKIRKQTPDQSILIITNDNDYLQLLDDHTTIINTKKQELKNRFNEETLKCFTMWKVIRGDDSDNIPSIEKKIGNVMALKLATDEKLRKKKLMNQTVANQYELNDILINFNRIPDEIRKGIEKLAF